MNPNTKFALKTGDTRKATTSFGPNSKNTREGGFCLSTLLKKDRDPGKETPVSHCLDVFLTGRVGGGGIPFFPCQKSRRECSQRFQRFPNLGPKAAESDPLCIQLRWVAPPRASTPCLNPASGWYFQRFTHQSEHSQPELSTKCQPELRSAQGKKSFLRSGSWRPNGSHAEIS